MSASLLPKSGIVLFHSGGVVSADIHAAQLLGMGLDELSRASIEQVLTIFDAESRERLEIALSIAEGGEIAPRLDGLCLGSGRRARYVDALADLSMYHNRPMLRLVLLGDTPAQVVDEWQRRHFERLQILREIDHAILSSRDETEIVITALSRLGAFIPHYQAGCVVMLDDDEAEGRTRSQSGWARLLAIYPPELEQLITERRFWKDDLSVDLAVLQDGLPDIVHDLEAVTPRSPIREQMLHYGIRSYLAAPLREGGRLMGFLFLSAANAGVFAAEHVQIAQEVADSLAVALRQAGLRRDERRRRQEAAVMRDVMAALASAGNLRQTLEALLVNLHNLIDYDRAGLFLVDENEQVVRTERGAAGGDGPGQFLNNHPVVETMRRTRDVMVVADIQEDARFVDWPDVESVRGWLGAPLPAGERLLGFISLGALQPGAFSTADQETMRMFAAEISQVLERVWQDEQSRLRSEELEVLSNITFALGKAEGGSDTLAAILAQVARFFNAERGAVLVHDPARQELVVKACLDPELHDAVHPFQDDGLWDALASGKPVVIAETDELARFGPSSLIGSLFGGGGSAVVLPLSSFGSSFGLLCLGFETRRRFSAQTLNLFHTVAEIAEASLRRAVVLEALEKQVTIRTQHLSTLYRINAAAGEPLPLNTQLNRVLDTVLEALDGVAASIHLRDASGEQLELAARRSLSEDAPSLETLSLNNAFWSALATAPDPVITPDISTAENIPEELAEAGLHHSLAYIGVPIRVKGELLGVLSVFGETILNYTIDDLTLFTTIADQIGGLVERARLVRQAELAAVVQERQRLARELHDSVTQLLYSQVLFSGASLKELRHGNRPLTESHLARIESAAQQALKEMRLLVYELRPSNEMEEGLAAALERRLEAVERRTGMVARLIANGSAEPDRETSMELFRIAEEALNNTLKHSGAQTVLVGLRFTDHSVDLEVADDGCGFTPGDRPGGMGLSTMSERAAQLGSELVLDTAPGQGTRVAVRVQF